MADMHAELETAQRYAANQLSVQDAEAFEAHLLTCDRCQAEVRFAAGLRNVARAVPTTEPWALGFEKAQNPKPRAATFAWKAGVAVLIAAGIIAVVVLQRPDPRLTALGKVAAPPEYRGMTVRAMPRAGDSLFAAAMRSYVARDYGAAASDLRAALANGVDSVPALFFLASSELMAGDARTAAATYARVVAAGKVASSYLDEAHLFRARALLQLGRGDDALAELSLVTRDDPVYGAAAALQDSVKRVLSR